MNSTESTPTNMTIDVNLNAVRQRIAEAAKRAGRDPAEITLVAVSKTKPFEDIVAAMEAGQVDFGENRLDELHTKVERAQNVGLNQIRWHVIGTIQSRKTSHAVGPYALVHSVDRVKIAQRLSRDAESTGVVMPVLLEANVSGEESKHGFRSAELLQALPQMAELPGIEIQGLMTMAPFVADPEETRLVFRQLRQLRDQLHERHPTISLPHLSMGMTNDFEVAIEEGATIVRVGSAIFGARNYA